MLRSLTSNNGTVSGWLASIRKEPLPSLDICGSKLTPVVARTPSRLSREKCFNSIGEAGGWRELVHALIASDTTRARDLFFMLPPSGLTTQLVGQLMKSHFEILVTKRFLFGPRYISGG